MTLINVARRPAVAGNLKCPLAYYLVRLLANEGN